MKNLGLESETPPGGHSCEYPREKVSEDRAIVLLPDIYPLLYIMVELSTHSIKYKEVF